MTSKLQIYNDALLVLGERRINSLNDRSPSRLELDAAYDQTIAFVLEDGYWNFAMRSVLIDPTPSLEPSFGYSHGFQKPEDWVRTHSFSASENFDPPLLDVRDENGIWYAHVDPLYLRYVSNDPAYGRDLSLWPQTVATFGAHELAKRTCKRITGEDFTEKQLLAHKRARGAALSRDAMNEPPAFPPRGSWANSRQHGWSNRSRWNGRST